MAELFDLATSAASNTARFPENMQFRTVNDSARELEAMIARTQKDQDGSLSASGSSNAFSVTTNRTISGYTDNLRLSFRANHTITGAPTINVSGLGAKSILAADGSALISGDIVSGQTVDIVYKTAANAFQLISGRSGIPTSSSTSLKVGDVVITLDATPKAGRIRLTESAQTVVKASYPELDQWASAMSYPWGSTGTTFTLPSAAGYFLRFAATSSSIDTSGPRVAGSTQSDQNKAHTHTVNGTAAGSISVTSSVSNVQQNTVSNFVSTGAGVSAPGTNAGAISSTGTASLSVTGTAASDGGAEVRTKNVAMHADIIASSAQANVGVYGVNGVPYTWDSDTAAADPGSGRLRVNNATISSATSLYISETGATSESLASWLATWTSTGASPYGTLYIVKIGAVGNQAIFNVTSTMTDAGAYQSCTISYVSSTGTFSNGDPIGVLWVPRGLRGDTGASGSDGGFEYKFSTTTTMADPTAGYVRANNATLASATQLAISASTNGTGNPDISDYIVAWDDSTSTTKGQIVVRKSTSGGGTVVVYAINGSITDNGTWLQIPVSCVLAPTGTVSNNDALLISALRTGDKGLDGAGSGTVTGVTAGPGLSATGAGSTGGTIVVAGTLTAVEPVNAQTGTSYTVVAADHGKLLTLSNTASIAVTLPQATSSFGAGFFFDVANINVGVVTITPTTSTINGAATLVLNRFQSARIISDGTNYQVMLGNSFRTQTTTIASASTTDIGATASQRISVTGTTTITSFGTVANQLRFVSFTGALTLTHNATTLILPGSANITTAAGDCGVFSSDSSGNWRCLSYQKADGTAVVAPATSTGWVKLTSQTASASASIAFTTNLTSTYDHYMIAWTGVVPQTNDVYMRLRVDIGSGYATTNYTWGGQHLSVSGGASTGSTTDSITTAIALNRPSATTGVGNTTGYNFSGFVFFSDPDATKLHTFVTTSHRTRASGEAASEALSGQYATSGVISGLQFSMSSGNIASGTFTLYGLTK